MYKLYIDKNEIFEAAIQVDGLESNVKPKCRLVLENSKFNFLFEGKVENNKCVIPIKKLKSILEEGDTGTLKLEVIADDVFFTPWQQEFTAHLGRKLTVEVKSSASPTIDKPKVTATVANSFNQKIVTNDMLIKELNSKFIKYGIGITNVTSKTKHIKLIAETVLKSKKYSKLKLNQNDFINIIVKSLPIKK